MRQARPSPEHAACRMHVGTPTTPPQPDTATPVALTGGPPAGTARKRPRGTGGTTTEATRRPASRRYVRPSVDTILRDTERRGLARRAPQKAPVQSPFDPPAGCDPGDCHARTWYVAAVVPALRRPCGSAPVRKITDPGPAVCHAFW